MALWIKGEDQDSSDNDDEDTSSSEDETESPSPSRRTSPTPPASARSTTDRIPTKSAREKSKSSPRAGSTPLDMLRGIRRAYGPRLAALQPRDEVDSSEQMRRIANRHRQMIEEMPTKAPKDKNFEGSIYDDTDLSED